MNLRRPTSSEKGVCVYHPPTLHFVQRGEWCRRIFRSFPKEKRFPFLHGRLLSLPLVSRHTPCFFAFGCSLHLPLAAVTPKAPGTRRSQSQNKKTPCLCMMFFELRRQDLKATPWASPRGPRYTSFCMRHLHNKKTPHTYVYGVFF